MPKSQLIDVHSVNGVLMCNKTVTISGVVHLLSEGIPVMTATTTVSLTETDRLGDLQDTRDILPSEEV